jgi:Mg2+/citrate symporter
MPEAKWLIMMIVGGVFVILGIIAIVLGIREEKRIFEALSRMPDLREFSLKHVESPQPGALKIGGWIAIALGVLLVVAGIIFWQTGWPPD